MGGGQFSPPFRCKYSMILAGMVESFVKLKVSDPTIAV